MMKKIVVPLLFLFGCFELSAQGKEGFQVLITHENDFLTIANKDENYTGGLKLETLFKEIKGKGLPFLKYRGENTLTISRIGMGATAYTPQDLGSEAVVVGDRPYASLVFVNFGANSYHLVRNEMLQSEVLLGIMGTSLPGNAQAYLHENHWFGSERPVPKGWNNQIGYKGSFIINYNTRFQKALFSKNSVNSDFQWLAVHGVGKVDLGNYMIHAQAGLKLNLLNWNSTLLQDQYPNLETLTRNETTTKKIRCNLFAEPTVRFVGYNATLEGLLFKDNSIYKIDHSDVKRMLFEINAGFNLTLYDVFYLRYSHSGRSREFEGGKSFHNWGAVTLGFSPQRWHSK
ncbi:lipid A-modifier LpxR family protein [Flavobacterium sp. GCM10023249]|uniref:lipid A-modifier LpxR family protein n=1 Tax=unclassified Flavobacterium TaxID=196869 RepID=UPI003618B2CD